MFEAAPMQGEEQEDGRIKVVPKVYLLSATPDPLGVLAAGFRMYSGKPTYDLSRVTDEEREWAWDESLKTHLKAPWEFIDLHFFIEGVTRAFTHQIVRQRTAVYAQESLRFAVKDEIAARPGPIISGNKQKLAMWQVTIERVWQTYQWLIENGVPAEEARGLLPHDTLTRLNYKTNLRNLAEHLGNRLCTQAQFEWRMVGSQIKQAISEYNGIALANGPHPSIYVGNNWQFKLIADSGIFKPVCFAVGRCPFQADFDRGCTIRDRMDNGRADEVRDEEWAADPTAAWIT